MKRKLLPLMIASACGYAAADIDVYGKVNISLNKMDTETASGADDNTATELNSNASRFGLKGSYALNQDGSLKAIYKLEYEVAVDDGSADSDEFKQRNIYGGFSSRYGTLIAGKHDTPTKLAQGKIDRFNDMVLGDIKNVIVGENRESNLIMYSSPACGGFTGNIAIILGEDGSQSDDAVSASLDYSNGGLRLAIARDQGVDSTDVTRFVAEYTGGSYKLGALLQSAEEEIDRGGISGLREPVKDYNGSLGFDGQDAIIVSGEAKLTGNIIVKAQLASATSEASGGDVDVSQIALGADYKFNKQAKAYVYVASVEAEPDGSAKSVTSAGDQTDTTAGIGFEFKF